MNLETAKLSDNIQEFNFSEYTRHFDKVWDRTIFISSIVGLIFLFIVSLFRYYYIFPEQRKITPTSFEYKKLQYENKALKKEIEKLKNQLYDEN